MNATITSTLSAQSSSTETSTTESSSVALTTTTNLAESTTSALTSTTSQIVPSTTWTVQLSTSASSSADRTRTRTARTTTDHTTTDDVTATDLITLDDLTATSTEAATSTKTTFGATTAATIANQSPASGPSLTITLLAVFSFLFLAVIFLLAGILFIRRRKPKRASSDQSIVLIPPTNPPNPQPHPFQQPMHDQPPMQIPQPFQQIPQPIHVIHPSMAVQQSHLVVHADNPHISNSHFDADLRPPMPIQMQNDMHEGNFDANAIQQPHPDAHMDEDDDSILAVYLRPPTIRKPSQP